VPNNGLSSSSGLAIDIAAKNKTLYWQYQSVVVKESTKALGIKHLLC